MKPGQLVELFNQEFEHVICWQTDPTDDDFDPNFLDASIFPEGTIVMFLGFHPKTDQYSQILVIEELFWCSTLQLREAKQP